MKRFASFATSAALAGALLCAGTVSQAGIAYNMYLVPTNGLTVRPGGNINFNVLIDFPTGPVLPFALFLGPAIATPEAGITQTMSTSGSGAMARTVTVGPQVSFVADTSKFQPYVDALTALGDPNPVGNSPRMWDQLGSNVRGTAVSGQKTVQYGIAHSKQLDPGDGTSILTIPAGTYTVGTYTFTALSTDTVGQTLNFKLPSAYGLSDPNVNATKDIVSDNIGGSTVSFPDTVQKPAQLTFTVIPGTPAPSSLLVVAMGVVPLVGVLSRRRH